MGKVEMEEHEMSMSMSIPHNIWVDPSEDEDEPDENRHVCRTCARFIALDKGDRYTLRCLHLRSDDLEAVMEGAGICAGVDDEEERDPVLVLAEDDTCGEWEGQ